MITGQRDSTEGSILALLLPLLGLFKIELGGQLYVHEIILACLCGAYLFGVPPRLSKSVVWLLWFGVLWLVGQVATDIIVETSAADFLRGWARILFFLAAIYSLLYVLDKPRNVLIWITASIIPLAIRPFQLFYGDWQFLILWKFGLGSAVLILLIAPILLRFYRNENDDRAIVIISMVHLGVGVASFFLNARSFAGICIFTATLCVLYAKYRTSHIGVAQLATGFVGFLIIANLLAAVYTWGAASGKFGEDARDKYEMQVSMNGGGLLSLLLGGRSESLVSTIAIGDSPLVGHGSWAKDYKYTQLLVYLKNQMFESESGALILDDDVGLIPSHSYLLGSWVEAGILGGSFWIVVLCWLLFFVFPAAWAEGGLIGLVVIVTLPTLVWNILFSPFGANVRVDVAALVAVYSLALNRYSTRYV